MSNKSLSLTYTSSLPLKWKDLSLHAGLCLSRCAFQYLQKDTSSFLHPIEEAYFSNLVHPRRLYSYLLGRYCAKQSIMACYNDVNVREIAIESGVFDHPVITCSPRSSLQVSISHTKRLGAAISFSETYPMAIDVETICPSKKDAIKTQLTVAEQKFRLYPSKAKEAELTQHILLWTVKEALSKALRCGLTVPFEVLEIESIKEEKEGFMISTFKNFQQYQAVSFCLDTDMCSIVYPRYSSLDIDLDSIQKSLQECK